MNRYLFLILGIGLILAPSGCGSSKKAFTLSFRMIAFGESGGIVGAGQQYGLSRTGLLLKTAEENTEPEMIGNIPEAKLREISKMAIKAMEVKNFRQEPGNLNRKLLIQTEDTYYQYYWSMPEDTIASEITGLYQELQKLVQETQSAKP